MESKHTPGPWGIDYVTTDVQWPVVNDASDNPVCEIVLCYLPDTDDADPCKQEAEANARLIAAAPDLLDALKSSLQFVAAWQTEYLDKNDPQRICVDEQIKKTRAAITKASQS